MTASDATTTTSRRATLQLIPSPQPNKDLRAQHQVALANLHFGDSPRLGGLNMEHVQRLVESGEWPPILVHPDTMQILDGAHRVQASRELRRTHIPVEFFTGETTDLFLESVTRNGRHGLPLNSQERKDAVRRLLETHAHLSDRDLAHRVGVTHSTVAALRTAMRALNPVSGSEDERRLGSDGRSRPINPQPGRQRLMDFFAQNPGASLSEAALAAGVSKGTAKSVRDLVGNVNAPKSRKPTKADGRTPARPCPRAPLQPDEMLKIVHRLSADPACRRSHSARALMELLRAVITLAEEPALLNNMPATLVKRIGIPDYHHEQLQPVLDSCARWFAELTQARGDLPL